MKKQGQEQEKEQEKLGKLEYSLDYNFTESQVGPVWMGKPVLEYNYSTHNNHTFLPCNHCLTY